MVSVATAWQKRDLIEHYGLADEQVQVVAGAPPTDLYPIPGEHDLQAVGKKFDLPSRFIFFPAQTWPHKNHLMLLDALALLRDRESITIPLVCSGKRNDFYPQIESRISELGLKDQVQFLGFVDPLELQCLYRLCRAVIFPSLFEGLGFPLMEAFLAARQPPVPESRRYRSRPATRRCYLTRIGPTKSPPLFASFGPTMRWRRNSARAAVSA